MKALISGQAGIAVCIENGQFYSLNVDSLDTWSELHECEIRRLISDANDLLQLDNASRSDVFTKLKVEWAQDRSLQLVLILLDKEEETEIRIEAAECLNDFFNQEEVTNYVANRLYSSPLPLSADLNGAVQLSSGFSLVTTFFSTLQKDQDEISKRVTAWNALPNSLFENNDKSTFHADAIRHGVFRIFVTERHKKNLAIVNLLSHPYFRGSSRARTIFQKWAAPFKESAINIEFESPETDYAAFDEAKSKSKKRHKGGIHFIYKNAEKQKDAIKKLLRDGKH